MEHVVSYRIKAIDDITHLQRKVNTLNDQSQVGFKKLGTKIDQVNAPTRRLLGNLKQVGAQGLKTQSSLMAGFGKMKNMLSGPMVGAMAGAFSIGKIVQFGSAVVSTLSKFEAMEMQLEGALGSKSAAQTTLKQIKELADRTPFQAEGLTDSFTRMASRGVVPTMDKMTLLGDLAASLNKPFEQLNEALLDVTNTERWTEVGIKVSTIGDKIRGTYRNVTVEAERSEAGALQMLTSLAQQAPGVMGMMEKLADSTGGKISTLGDRFTTLKLTIGQGLRPVIIGAISFMEKLTDIFIKKAEWLKNNEALVKRFTENALTKMWQAVEHIGKGISVMIDFWQKNGDTIMEFGKTVWTVLEPVLGLLIKMGMWVMKFYALFYGTLIKVWKTAYQIGKNIIGFFVDIKNGISSFFEWMEEKIGILGTIIKNTLVLPLLPYIAIFKGVKAIVGKKKENQLDQRLHDLPGNKVLENVGLLPGGDKGLLGRPRVDDRLLSLPGNELLKNVGVLSGSSNSGFLKPSSSEEVLFGKPKDDSTTKEKSKTLSDRATDVKGVVSGEIKHITINIQKLVETLMIKTENLGMSESQVKTHMTRLLLSAVNDTQQSN